MYQTENPYKDHNWGRSCKSQKCWINLERANCVKYNLLTSCAANRHTSWSAAAFIFTFVTVQGMSTLLCVFVLLFVVQMGGGGCLWPEARVKHWKTNECLVWIIFQTTGKEQDRITRCTSDLQKIHDPPRVKPNTFSLPPHLKWYIFFNCDILLILAWWKKDESKGNWLMDYISHAMDS